MCGLGTFIWSWNPQRQMEVGSPKVIVRLKAFSLLQGQSSSEKGKSQREVPGKNPRLLIVWVLAAWVGRRLLHRRARADPQLDWRAARDRPCAGAPAAASLRDCSFWIVAPARNMYLCFCVHVQRQREPSRYLCTCHLHAQSTK